MYRLSVALLSLGGAALAYPAIAQTTPAAGVTTDDDTIVVNGTRPPGSVIGDIAPEVTLSPGDIRSFGVSSLSDLIAELAPQIASGQGRGGESPVVLLNGKRISTFAEVRDIPAEAIQRVEILPEEVALKYGYRANQKVVNVVLRRRFNAFTGELEAAAPTEGGQFSPETDNSYFRNGAAGRLNLALKYQHSSALYESERDIIPQPPRQPYDEIVNGSGLGRYRTLLPETDTLTMNAVFARTIFNDISASINGTFTYNDSRSAQGLAAARLTVPAGSPFSASASDTLLYRYLSEFGALGQQSRDITGHLGATFNGTIRGWQWSLTGSFDHTASRTITDAGYDLSGFQGQLNALDPLADPFAPIAVDRITGTFVNRARAISNVGDAQLVVSGAPFALPAGPATATFTLGGTTSDFKSRSIRSGTAYAADLSRDDANGQVSLDLPITSRKNNVLPGMGDLSVNLNLAYERLSDFGGLRTFGLGLTWKPVKPLSVIASLSKDEGAPTIQQLGNPLVTTNGVRVFDYVRGETVDITRISGGNPDLSADDRRVFKLGMTLKPFTKIDLSLSANYTNSRVRDPIASFPAATAAIEAAFPDRFTRDASGRLQQIDSSPINFARQDREMLRWGFNFSKQLSAPPRSATAAPEGAPVSLRDLLPPGQSGSNAGSAAGSSNRTGAGGAGGSGGGQGAGGFGRGGGGRGTRLQIAVYHTLHLRDEILVYDGGPVLNLLKGDAITSSGGQPRNEVQAQAGLTHNGFGARLSASWQSGTTVNGGTGGTQSLRFSGLTTLNLRLFANLGQQQALIAKLPFLRGTRLSLAVTNLFNTRLHVRDANGDTPISYQPAYLDPLGRAIRISIRKLFF